MLDRKMKMNTSKFKSCYNTFVAYCAEHNFEQYTQQIEKFRDNLIEREKCRTVRNYLEKEEKVKLALCIHDENGKRRPFDTTEYLSGNSRTLNAISLAETCDK